VFIVAAAIIGDCGELPHHRNDYVYYYYPNLIWLLTRHTVASLSPKARYNVPYSYIGPMLSPILSVPTGALKRLPWGAYPLDFAHILVLCLPLDHRRLDPHRRQVRVLEPD
jgi:hypothetical protein